jgi:hypothetical protein
VGIFSLRCEVDCNHGFSQRSVISTGFQRLISQLLRAAWVQR